MGLRAGGPGLGYGHRVQPHLVEMGVLCGRQPEALLAALKGQQVGQQASSDSDILTEVVVSVARHLP